MLNNRIDGNVRCCCWKHKTPPSSEHKHNDSMFGYFMKKRGMYAELPSIRPHMISFSVVDFKKMVLNFRQHGRRHLAPLTPARNVTIPMYVNFQTNFRDWHYFYKEFLWNCPKVNIAGPEWLLVKIGSGNRLVSSGNKPLPEPLLDQTCIAIWCH